MKEIVLSEKEGCEDSLRDLLALSLGRLSARSLNNHMDWVPKVSRYFHPCAWQRYCRPLKALSTFCAGAVEVSTW